MVQQPTLSTACNPTSSAVPSHVPIDEVTDLPRWTPVDKREH